MVRSLLDSSLLTRSAGLRFVLMLLGVCVLLGSVPVWLGAADFDYHYSYERKLTASNTYQQIDISPYRQLTGEEKHVVDAALDGKTFDFEDDTKDLPGLVSKNGAVYKFDARRAVDWTSPGSFVPVLVGVVGLWLTVEAVQHERKDLGPRGY